MKLINGQMWIDLEEHLDMNAFDAMHDQIVHAIAKNAKYIEPSYTLEYTLLDKTRHGFLEEKLKNREKIPEFKNDELNWYTKLQGASTLGSHLILRGNRGYPDSYPYKHLKENAVVLPASFDFDFLFEWLHNQNCFTEYGRTMFWINEPGQHTALHTDYGNINSNKKDMFIWLTGRFRKKIVLQDEVTGELHTSSHRAMIFNTINWHGSYGHDSCSSWSLRVDGNFNPEWAEKVGIREHYNI
jgi:hypothetical protein